VGTSHAGFIALAVYLHVVGVAGFELGHCVLDGFDAAVFAHGFGGAVGVQTGAIPVAGDGLGCEGDFDAELLGDAVQEKAGYPHLVAH